MKTKKSKLTFTIALLVSVFVSSAQSPTIENYNIVILKKSAVSNALNNPSFAYFDFTFQQVGDKVYSLAGFAKDANDNQIGSLITLAQKPNTNARPLPNVEKGHLVLTLEAMKSHNVNGKEDYVLTPKKCKDGSGRVVPYVSYRFSNKVYTGNTGLLNEDQLIDFDLNPSPPY